MAVADPSLSLDFQHPGTNTSPRPPRTLSPISNPKRPLSFTNNCLLPFIDQTQGAGSVIKTEAQPSSLAPMTSDFLPADLLTSLKRQSPRGGVAVSRHPPGFPRHPLPKAGTTAQTGNNLKPPPPASLWNYSSRRSKLKHLTDAPPCICGAGRDISFLYDTDIKNKDKEPVREKSVLPDTLVPEDYHVVKHPGVLGLEFHEDPYVTRSENHDHHMTVFPSMKPAGRHEAVTLKHSLDTMLQRAGLPNELKDSDLKGPTEMHNLLELLQKEQTIYNICFHELIRQVSVHCVERGELLADVRRRYNNLLDRIPRQVKSLHDELVAQRALDRKLSTELKRFKNRISTLTDELSGVKEHDLHVTEQSRIAEDSLANALAGSEKNANLLAEYHALYELQRKRLEDQVSNLTFERDLWQQASYDLAQRVADECNLQTLQRIQLSEKSWCKLAGHFAVLLSDKDTQQLSEVQSYVQQWREQVIGVTHRMRQMEDRMRERLGKVEKGMKHWSEEFDSIVDTDGVVHTPNKALIERLFSEVKVWQEIINNESENFAGDTLVNHQEEIASLRSLVERWTEVSVKLFTRHQTDVKGDGLGGSSENKRMLVLNSSIDGGLKQCGERVSGENGVATGFIHVITPLETWDTKLSLCLTSADKKSNLPASDWVKLRTLLKEWTSQIHNIIGYIGTVSKPIRNIQHESTSQEGEDKEREDDDGADKTDSPLDQLVVDVEKWRSALCHAIDSQDTQITEHVCRLHSLLVKWMVELLLCLTSTQVQQEHDMGHRQHITSTANLKADNAELAASLSTFTKMLSRTCIDVVRDIVDKRIQEDYPNPEEEQADLKRLGDEAEEWVKQAGLILEGVENVTEGEGGDKEEKNEESKERKESSGTSGEQAEVASDERADIGEDVSVPDQLPKVMSVVGIDDNIHPKSLQRVIDETEAPPISSSAELGLATEEVMPEGRGVQRKDAEALVITLDETNKKLEEQEAETKLIEERAQKAEKELEESKSMITELENELQEAKASIEQLRKGSGRGSRAGSRGSSVKRPRANTMQIPSSRPSSRKN